MPKSRLDYWVPKLEKNKQRDINNEAVLKASGWQVIVVWECELKKDVRDERLERLFNQITFENKKNIP